MVISAPREHHATRHAFDKSAGKLGVDRIDLLLLHQPLPSRFDLTLDAYRALATLLSDGKVRAIDVSNFMPHHLQLLLADVSVVPAVSQIEVHPCFQQTGFQRLHAEHGILTQARSTSNLSRRAEQMQSHTARASR
jgi:diketogulonate reductase-like aldo/keto reductase